MFWLGLESLEVWIEVLFHYQIFGVASQIRVSVNDEETYDIYGLMFLVLLDVTFEVDTLVTNDQSFFQVLGRCFLSLRWMNTLAALGLVVKLIPNQAYEVGRSDAVLFGSEEFRKQQKSFIVCFGTGISMELSWETRVEDTNVADAHRTHVVTCSCLMILIVS